MAEFESADYYNILNVSPTDAFVTIKASYHSLALLLHPDKNPSQNATEEFQKLGEAWETLKDAALKQAYDQKAPEPTGKSAPCNANAFAERARKAEEALREQERQAEARKVREENDAEERETTELRWIRARFQTEVDDWAKQEEILAGDIFEVKRNIQRHESKLRELDKIEKTEKAKKDSWRSRIRKPSYLFAKIAQTQQDKARKEQDKARKEHGRIYRLNQKESAETGLTADQNLVHDWEVDIDEGQLKIERLRAQFELLTQPRYAELRAKETARKAREEQQEALAKDEAERKKEEIRKKRRGAVFKTPEQYERERRENSIP